MGKRPDYAVVVYCNLIRSVYKDVPIIAGGIEASLRRLAHYDYWSNRLKRSILLDAQADLISYGMGEHSIIEIADALDSGLDVKDITFIDGTVYKTKQLENVYDYKLLPDYEELVRDKKRYAESFLSSTAIQIHFLENVWWSPMTGNFLWCRIRLQSPLRSRRWMTSMLCRI